MNKIYEYVAKPVTVKAVQFDRNNFVEIDKMIDNLATVTLGINYIKIKNAKQEAFVNTGEWVVLEQHGIFFKLTNPEFVEKYEKQIRW